MPTTYDAIIIGAGHNGLVTAAYLARAGQKVLVLERRDVLGGCCVTEEVWPGYKVSTAAYVNSLLRPRSSATSSSSGTGSRCSRGARRRSPRSPTAAL